MRERETVCFPATLLGCWKREHFQGPRAGPQLVYIKSARISLEDTRAHLRKNDGTLHLLALPRGGRAVSALVKNNVAESHASISQARPGFTAVSN